jgi:predicted nuclease of predicted toxin-antitoxin system
VSQQIRFHLDEHIDPNIPRGLRRYGIDVTTTIDAGLRTKNDELHLAFIREEQRVMVTHLG